NKYNNTNCFTTDILEIGNEEPSGTRNSSLTLSDGNCPAFGTAFGNSSVGVVRGPAQVNIDFSVIKQTAVKWPNEVANIEFRTEFVNVFNQTIFAENAK